MPNALDQLEATPVRSNTPDKSRPEGDGELVPIIVKLDLTPLASYGGGEQGLAPTQGLVEAGRTDAAARATIASYERYAADVQGAFERQLKNAIPRARVIHRLTWVYGGVSAAVPAARVAEVNRMSGVQSVQRDRLLKLQTERSPEFIGAPSTWSRLGGQKNAGRGVVVGVLDTGIWPEHPSYSDPDPAGKAYAAPPPAPDGDRECEFGTGLAGQGDPFTCSNKLIGADRFMDMYDEIVGIGPEEFSTARDDDGHGTHTSSTAAGNRQVAAEIFGVPRGTVSGIAPRAHLMMYKVCGESGCFISDSAAAIQEAIQDGVDVINFSISGGDNPYTDPVSLAFLDAYAAGVFVAASGGNSGPGADTVGHREPWVTTVAASTSDRHFLTTGTLTSDDGPDLEVVGASVTSGSGSFPLVIADDVDCLDEGPDNDYDGQIVLCRRSPPARVLKSFAVGERGAEGMVLYNPTLQGLNTDNHFVPTIHVEVGDGEAILEYLDTYTNVEISWPVSSAQEVPGDVMAAFSSRGGPGQTLGISKPDVTAPGVQILAGHTPDPATPFGGKPGELFQAIAGTSMSSPHVAGAAALLADLKPDWAPGQIKSALMTTAFQKVFKEDGVTRADPFDHGSGRIDLSQAHDPGITFSASAASYFLNEDSLYDANYPSVYVPDMPGRIVLKRNARNELSSARVWQISTKSPADFQINTPDEITIAGGGQAFFRIALDASAVPLGEVRHAKIILKSGPYKARMPVTIVRSQGGAVTVDKECAPTHIANKTDTACTIDVTNTTFEDAQVTIKDNLPDELKIRPTTLTGATLAGNGLFHETTLEAGDPPEVTVDPLGLDLYTDARGFELQLGLGDEDGADVTFGGTVSFVGRSWDTVGVVSNGYAVVGGVDSVQFENTDLPDPTPPNTLLAPYWTDLDPSAGGEVFVNVFGTGSFDCFDATPTDDCYLVIEWQNVPEFSNPDTTAHTFQIWLGYDSDASPEEEIYYFYDGQTGTGDLGNLTVGAENQFGNRGEAVYFNGEPIADLPADGDSYFVESTVGTPGETHTITFDAKGRRVGEWTNCAVIRGSTFDGRATDCVSGEVTSAQP